MALPLGEVQRLHHAGDGDWAIGHGICQFQGRSEESETQRVTKELLRRSGSARYEFLQRNRGILEAAMLLPRLRPFRYAFPSNRILMLQPRDMSSGEAEPCSTAYPRSISLFGVSQARLPAFRFAGSSGEKLQS